MESHTVLAGKFFDGRDTKAHPSTFTFDHENFSIEGAFGRIDGNRSKIEKADAFETLGVIILDSGERFEVSNNKNFATFIREFGLGDTFEKSSMRTEVVVVTCVATLAVLAFLYFVVIPKTALLLVDFIPQKVVRNISDQTKKALKLAHLTDEPELNEDETERASKIFARMREMYPNDGLKFNVISGKYFGANAFALPDGTIQITDKILHVLYDDDQIVAILLHEVGHVKHKHGLRHAIEASGVTLLLSTILGDSTATIELPSLVLISAYSRDFETEADKYAAKKLETLGLSPQLLADSLKILEDSPSARDSTNAPAFLSTHPLTEERIENLRKP